MRRSIAGLSSLVLTAGLVVGQASLTAAAPAPTAEPISATGDPGQGRTETAPGGDEDVHPLEAKRRALKQTALTGVLDGTVVPEKRAGGTVARVGKRRRRSDDRPGRSGLGAGRRRRRHRARPVRRAQPRGDRPDPRRAGRVREPAAPGLPGPRHLQRHRRPGPTFDGPLHNEIPKPGPDDNSTVWQPSTTTPPTTGTCTSARARARCRATTRGSPPAATASTARSPVG